MSTPFYDLASLVVLPSGVKAQKVYAQKPMTTDGQLTFSRASTATRVNASGLIETVASNVPRLDYLNSSCPKLQLEPSRTNLVTRSSEFDHADWGSASLGITANQAVSPDGLTNADLAVNTASSSYIFQGIAGAISGTYTASIFVKKGSQSSIAFGLVAGGFTGGISVKFNFDTQTFSTPTNYANFTSISASYQSYGNGWYRLNLTGTTATATTYFFVLGSLLENFAVNAFIYGAQVEAGAHATSLIPTTTAAVTRLADACSKTGISSLIGQTEGTLFLDFVAQTSTTSQSHFWLGSAGNEIGIYGGGSFIFYPSGGVSIAGGSFVTGQRYKIAFAYKANDYVAYVNGVQKGTDTSATVPAMSALYINSYIDFTETQKRDVNQALLFKTRLTNAQLAELTTL
jgi:hypothetical protein